MTRLRIDLAYDGGGFYGWAKQPNLRTVQGTIAVSYTHLDVYKRQVQLLADLLNRLH